MGLRRIELLLDADGATAWEEWRAIATEVDQMRLSGQAIAKAAESLHLFQVHVSYLGWTNDLDVKLNDAKKHAERVLTIIESLRRFTK